MINWLKERNWFRKNPANWRLHAIAMEPYNDVRPRDTSNDPPVVKLRRFETSWENIHTGGKYIELQAQGRIWLINRETGEIAASKTDPSRAPKKDRPAVP